MTLSPASLSPTTLQPDPALNHGAAAPRIEARLKVTGAARYPADEPVAHLAYAWLVTSAAARGRVAAVDVREARALPGVLDVLTHENSADVRATALFSAGGTAATSIAPLADTRLFHDGQIVAMVVADRFETAREAGHLVRVRYDAQTPSTTLDSAGTTRQTAAEANPKHEDPSLGDAQRSLAAAPVRVDARYRTPAQHHQAMELFSTTAVWSGDELTLYEPSQFVYALKQGVADQLGLDPAKVRVVSRYVGGAFGSKAAVTPRSALVAHAARRVGRPVRLVMTRQQAFNNTTYRAETEHHVRLGAERDGRLRAYLHEAWELSSRPDPYFVGGTETTALMYACTDIHTRVNVVHADRSTPGFMRSPAEMPYVFALETALDELAVALGMDPVELRRRNETAVAPVSGKPFSSRSLMRCYDEAARAFGWSRRSAATGSMRDGDWLIGWGCATAIYPSNVAPATARVRIEADGRVHVQLAAHDIGTGTYTVAAQVVAERLGLPLERVSVEMGDSRLPAAPVSGGSNVTASIASVLQQACDDLRRQQAAGQRGALEAYAEWLPPGQKPEAIAKLQHGSAGLVPGSQREKVTYAFGAEFVEVRVHRRTREIRVPRIVGAFAAGRIVNPRTAHSQLQGGLIWGIGSALHEASELDARAARYVNDDIAEYLIPVNADIVQADVIFVPETDDYVNPAGVKGLGELGNVGTAAAISNAVYHATGRRLRDLPIRLEDLL